MSERAHNWIPGLPLWWTPPAADRVDAWVTLTVLGALWAADLAQGDLAWSGEALHGDGAAVLAALKRWRPARIGKGGIVLGIGADGGGESGAGITVDPRRARADLWSGQVDALMIWTSCAHYCDPAAPLDTEVYGDPDGPTLSATGYDWIAVNDPVRDGFSIAGKGKGYSAPNIRFPRRPAVELLALLGVEWCIRRGLWQRRRAQVGLPLIAGVALRDASDAAALRPEAVHGVVMVGRRRYIAAYGMTGAASSVPAGPLVDRRGPKTLAMLIARSGLSVRSAARRLRVNDRTLRRMISGEEWIAVTDPLIGRAAMLPPAGTVGAGELGTDELGGEAAGAGTPPTRRAGVSRSRPPRR